MRGTHCDVHPGCHDPGNPGDPGEAGFSLIEMLVTLVVTALLVVGILGVFDFNNKVAHVQTQVSDMQQSLRVAQYEMVRYVRMAGRGGVPSDRAVELRNNVG